ncbi:MAG: CotH kinase family protein, partial [Clostridia bacterium]|nr:CotH kinase family protein [Clostridia bacterium]
RIWIVALVFLMALTFSLLINAEPQSDITVLWTSENGETVEIFPTKSNFYLPAAVDLTKIRFSSGVLKEGETLDLTPYKTTDAQGAECYRVSLTVNGKTAEYTFYQDSKLGSVFVQTSIGLSAIHANKNKRDKGAKILVLDDLGQTEYSDISANTNSEIKGRGNATWSYLKKAYQIKLDSKTELLGMDKAKTWILLANYTDQSSLHNALGFMLGDVLDVPYNIDYRFVHLYVDGEYLGMYMLCEKVQIDGNRIDIEDLEKATEKANPDKDLEKASIQTVRNGSLINNTILTKYTYCKGVASPEDITGGYLVELDFRGESEPCHFVTENGNIYVVKSPEYASKEEMEYIAGLFADMEEAIYSETGYNRKGVHYSEYIDMESFAAVYTVQELMKNWDAYLGSMFFFKDADKNGETAKIYNGPLWDLDNTLGNIRYDKYFFDDTSFLWAQNGVFQNYTRTFGKKLMSHADFHNTVADKYAVAYDAVQEALSEGGWMEKTVSQIGEGVAMERERWKFYDHDSWLLNASGYKVNNVKFIEFTEYGTPQDNTQNTALGFLRYYLSSRADALLLSIGQKVEEEPPVQPPEGTTSSSSEQMTTETTQSALDSEEPIDEQPAAPSVSPVTIIAVFAVIFVILGAGLVFVFVKKRTR